jgi:hypothetical protein
LQLLVNESKLLKVKLSDLFKALSWNIYFAHFERMLTRAPKLMSSGAHVSMRVTTAREGAKA